MKIMLQVLYRLKISYIQGDKIKYISAMYTVQTKLQKSGKIDV